LFLAALGSWYVVSQQSMEGLPFEGEHMIIELMSVSVSPKKKQKLGRALGSLVGPTQVQRGCLSCHLFESLPKQDSLQLEARWECQEDLIRHLQSEDYKRLLILMELSTTPPVVEFLYVAEVRGLELVGKVRRMGV
jgi:quinol monooxygenase YgiN